MLWWPAGFCECAGNSRAESWTSSTELAIASVMSGRRTGKNRSMLMKTGLCFGLLSLYLYTVASCKMQTAPPLSVCSLFDNLGDWDTKMATVQGLARFTREQEPQFISLIPIPPEKCTFLNSTEAAEIHLTF